MPLDSIESSVLLVAAFFGGALNAVAGGGSFLTLPALIFVGVPPVAANATGTVALLPGYGASAWAYREELRGEGPLPLRALVGLALLGGALGAGLLLTTSDAVFRQLVPALLLFATAIFALGPALLRRLQRGGGHAKPLVYGFGVLTVSIYGGYFNGGLGIMLLAAFSLLGHGDINRMNALKNLLSAVLTVIAVSLYAAGGAVVWSLAMVMVVSAIAGGYVGGRVGRRLPAGLIRAVVIGSGCVMAALFLVF